jgi:hypothetical protein
MHAASSGSSEPTFRDELCTDVSGQQVLYRRFGTTCRYRTTTQCCVISKKSEDLTSSSRLKAEG